MWTLILVLLPSISRCAPPFSQELKNCDDSGPRVSELSLNSALSTFLCYTEEEIGAMEEVEKKRKLAQKIAPLFRYEHSYEDLVEELLKMPSDSLVKTVNIVMNSRDVETDPKTIEGYGFINELLDTNVDSDLNNPHLLSLLNSDMEDLGRNGRVALLHNFFKWVKFESDGGGSPNNATPQILTSRQTFHVSVGDSVLLPCSVHNLGSLVPLWKHKQNVLTAGRQMVNPNTSKYQLVNDYNLKITYKKYQLVNSYNLQIRNIQAFDAGDYTCYITTFGKPVTLTHTIEITGQVLSGLCNEAPSSCDDDVGEVFRRLSSGTGLTSGCGSCQPTEQYRRMDGICNNLEEKEKGAAGTSFSRFIMNAYEDGK